MRLIRQTGSCQRHRVPAPGCIANMRVAVVLLVVASAVAVHGQDCVITVPPNPLTAEGLATPYTVGPPRLRSPVLGD